MTNLHDSIALHLSWGSLKHTGTYGRNYIPEYSPASSGFRGLKRSWQNHANSWFQGAGCPVIPFCFVPQLYHEGFVPPRKYWTERIIGIQETHVFYQQRRRKCNHILEGCWFFCVCFAILHFQKWHLLCEWLQTLGEEFVKGNKIVFLSIFTPCCLQMVFVSWSIFSKTLSRKKLSSFFSTSLTGLKWSSGGEYFRNPT